MTITVRRAVEGDLERIAELNAVSFSGNRDTESALGWISSRFKDPTFRMWVGELDGTLAGYITWQIQGGWHRASPVMELEQTAVFKDMQGKGVGHALIQRTIPEIADWVRETNRGVLDHFWITVWALVDNPANSLYRKFFPETAGFRKRYSRPENELIGKILLSAYPPKTN